MYVDEAGIDNREDYPYGYCEVGQRFHALKSGKRTQRVSWIAALKEGNLESAHDFFRFLQPRLVRDVVGRMLAATITTGGCDCYR